MHLLKVAAVLAFVLIAIFLFHRGDEAPRQSHAICENARNPYHTCGTFCEARKRYGSKVSYMSEVPAHNRTSITNTSESSLTF
jgi:hypothetical protein